uniref:Fungal lipase-type domain-containing protein n=1 Tax=Fagus sylvatica TaxID=28930 RepID=A0A2N9GYP0_FAGSY
MVASEWKIFCDSGPKDLTAVNWNDPQYRRSVVASLVRGVYRLENYRHQNGHVPQDLALPWWDFFDFQLKEWLEDNDGIGKSIFCAKYEYKYPSPGDRNIPQYVIAFRGTILKSKDTMFRDSKVNIQCFLNKLHKNSSFQNAIQYVKKNTVDLSRGASVWLAGHSMGSAMALLAGKKMARMDHFLTTYLFNPPFFSVPIDKIIKTEKVKFWIHITNSVLKAGARKLAVIGRRHRQHDHEAQAHDPFDQHVIGSSTYPFDQMKMEEIGIGKIEGHATKQSLMKLLSKGSGYSDSKVEAEAEAVALHLIPSAFLTINRGQVPDFNAAHALHQWWNPSHDSETMLYQYNTTTRIE